MELNLKSLDLLIQITGGISKEQLKEEPNPLQLIKDGIRKLLAERKRTLSEEHF